LRRLAGLDELARTLRRDLEGIVPPEAIKSTTKGFVLSYWKGHDGCMAKDIETIFQHYIAGVEKLVQGLPAEEQASAGDTLELPPVSVEPSGARA